MPTIAESGLQMNGDLIGLNYRLASTESWTDALPICRHTGVGTQTNQLYRSNGGRQEFHSCEDRSFHFCHSSDTYFYGLFDGHEGTRTADFVAQRLPAEFLFGQLPDRELTDDEIRALFQSAFMSLEKEYFQSIDGVLAEKASLELQIQGMSPLEAYQTFPEIMERLKSKTSEVSTGTTAVVALIHYNNLHVANVGDSKAILCRTDVSDPHSFKASQLSTDHDLTNDNELSRLAELGLEVDLLKQRQRIGNLSITRCIGNYLVKGGYKDLPDLCAARDEPIIAEPSIRSVILDDSCQFLVLASGSVFRTLEDVTGAHQVNSELVRMVAEEFKTQSTLTGVAQGVVNKICRRHQDEYLMASLSDSNLPLSRKQIEDLTLIVRNFNHPLKGVSSRTPSVSSMHRQFSDQLRISIDEEDEGLPDGDRYRDRSASKTLITVDRPMDRPPRSIASTVTDDSSTTTTNSTDFEDQRFISQKVDPLEVDAEGKIEAYVRFDSFFEALRKAKTDGPSSIELD